MVSNFLSEILRQIVNSATLVNIILLGAVAILRYLQVVIWGRVREIHEELAEVAILRSAWLFSLTIVFGFSYLGNIHYTLEAAFSQNTTIVMPIWTCQANKGNSC